LAANSVTDISYRLFFTKNAEFKVNKISFY